MLATLVNSAFPTIFAWDPAISMSANGAVVTSPTSGEIRDMTIKTGEWFSGQRTVSGIRCFTSHNELTREYHEAFGTSATHTPSNPEGPHGVAANLRSIQNRSVYVAARYDSRIPRHHQTRYALYLYPQLAARAYNFSMRKELSWLPPKTSDGIVPLTQCQPVLNYLIEAHHEQWGHLLGVANFPNVPKAVTDEAFPDPEHTQYDPAAKYFAGFVFALCYYLLMAPGADMLFFGEQRKMNMRDLPKIFGLMGNRRPSMGMYVFEHSTYIFALKNRNPYGPQILIYVFPTGNITLVLNNLPYLAVKPEWLTRIDDLFAASYELLGSQRPNTRVA